MIDQEETSHKEEKFVNIIVEKESAGRMTLAIFHMTLLGLQKISNVIEVP